MFVGTFVLFNIAAVSLMICIGFALRKPEHVSLAAVLAVLFSLCTCGMVVKKAATIYMPIHISIYISIYTCLYPCI